MKPNAPPFPHAAEQEMLQACMPMRPHHNEIDLMRVGMVDNALKWRGKVDDSFTCNARITRTLGTVCQDLVRLRLSLFGIGSDTDSHVSSPCKGWRLHDMQERDARLE
jgi:hypothetical protein